MLSDEGREKIQSWGRRRRSFSIFQCSEHDAAQIAEILGEVIPDLTTVNPSDLLDLPEPSGPVLLYRIASEDAYENAKALHRLVLRLIRWENQPVFLLSPDSREKWKKGNLWRGDGKIDNDGLRLDALTLILKQDSVIIPSTSILDLASDQPEMTYIEDLMAKALNEKGLSFKAQALIGRYHVDFLVEKNGAQVVVECDGKAYHSSDEAQKKDKERDSYLQERGYPVLRFTGGEINSRVGPCVEQIEQSLDESHMGQSQGFPLDSNLDDSQKKAVFTKPGQVCVLAPAGSGKTKVLTNRGIHLVNEGFREHRVLALAFNRKAKEEMQERLRKMGFSEVKRQVHTFNSYGADLLADKYALKDKGFAAYEGKRYYDMFFGVLEKHCGKHKRKVRFNQYCKEAINKTKGQLTPPGKFLQPMCHRFIVEECPKEADLIWSEIFEEFLQWQKDSNHLTFADQVYLAVRELAEDPNLRRRKQMSLDALLIDEFQDLDAAQLMLIEILALGHGNLFVVGDDDQMIYGWRGADIERLRRFLKDPHTHKVILSTNYRSSQLIVRHAGFLISHNTDREVKNVRSKDGTERGKVELFIGEDLSQERNFLVKTLNSVKEEGFQWKDLAVLVRYNELYQPVIDTLDRANIPFACEAKGKIYSRKAARALTDFFAAVLEFPVPQKDVWRHVLKVSDIYPRNEYLREVSQATDPVSFLRSGRNTRDAAQRKSIAKLLSNLRSLSEKQKSENLNTYDLLQAIDTTFRLTNHFKQELGASDDNDAADDGLVIDLLQEESKDFSDPRKFLKYCKDGLDREKIEDNNAEKDNIYAKDSKDAVQVMTIHKAKGKEWRGVFLFHQEWRQDSYRANESQEEQKRMEEEERRVVYVGATRAIKMLWVTARRKSKSRFVDELFRDPGFRDRDPQQEIEYRQERFGNLKQEIDQLKTEENQEHIKMDRAQGIERDRVRRELDAVKESAGFLRLLLWHLGLKSARLRQLEKECQTVEEADQAEQRVDQIQSQLDAKKKRIAEISEEMDRLKREERFRRILSPPIDTNGLNTEIAS